MKKPFILFMPILATLAGCASSLTGIDGDNRFACKAPDGITCASLSGVYANAVANNLPGTPKEGRAKLLAAASTGQAPTAGTPLRSPAQVMRIWIAPWEDSDGDLHDQSYLYVVANPGHWELGQSRKQILERYRPTFLRTPAPAAQAQKIGTPASKNSPSSGLRMVPGASGQSVSNTGSDQALAGEEE